MQTNETTKTITMLQRVPVILAVTAASYGLAAHNARASVQAQGATAQHHAAESARARH